jgi:tetratricopeptide (TPR) repeat protein
VVAAILNHLGELYFALNNYSEAEHYYKQALTIYQNTLGPEDPEVATDFSNLGEIYYSQGKYQDAQPAYQRAMNIDEKAGKSSSQLARDLAGLAGVYYHQEKYHEAEPLYRRALEIDETALGRDSLNVAGIERGLAAVLEKLNRPKEANAFIRRAKKIEYKNLQQQEEEAP